MAVEHRAHHVAGDGGLTTGMALSRSKITASVSSVNVSACDLAIWRYEEDGADGMYVDAFVDHGALLVFALTKSWLTESWLKESRW